MVNSYYYGRHNRHESLIESCKEGHHAGGKKRHPIGMFRRAATLEITVEEAREATLRRGNMVKEKCVCVCVCVCVLAWCMGIIDARPSSTHPQDIASCSAARPRL